MTNTIITIPLKLQSTELLTDSEKILYVPLATRETPGIIYAGSGLNVEQGVLSVDVEDISERLDYRVTIDEINRKIQDNTTRIEELEDEIDMSRYATKDELILTNARVSSLEANVSGIQLNIDSLTTDVDTISNDITELRLDVTTNTNNIETLITGLDEVENTVVSHTNSISDIESKIPTQATADNQLADKDFVNSTVQTSTANYRGSWESWNSVPTDVNQYPEDFAGNKTPTVNDYLVVRVSDDYHGEDIFTRVGETVGKYIDADGSIKNNADFAYSTKLNIPDSDDTHVRLTITANVMANIRIHAYNNSDQWLGQIAVGRTETTNPTIELTAELPDNTSYVRVSYPNAATEITLFTYQLVGTWRFKYTGNWSVKGKNGWEPEYQINETPLTVAQITALNSGITPELTNQITANKQSISTHTEQISAINSSLQDLGSDVTELRTDKVSFTDYATTDKGGVIKIGNSMSINSATGIVYASVRDYNNYRTIGTTSFISKGTLENIKNNYVKDGLTTNTIVLTDEEQTAFKTWMNISDEKGVFIIRISEEA